MEDTGCDSEPVPQGQEPYLLPAFQSYWLIQCETRATRKIHMLSDARLTNKFINIRSQWLELYAT